MSLREANRPATATAAVPNKINYLMINKNYFLYKPIVREMCHIKTY